MTTDPDGKFRLAVLPVQSDVEIDRLADIETVPEGTERVQDEKKAIRDRIELITGDMAGSIESRLSAIPYFTVIPASQVKNAMEGLGMQPP